MPQTPVWWILIKTSSGPTGGIGTSVTREVARRLVADGLHDPAIVITRSARGMLCAMRTALSWSVVRAQVSASSWLIPCT